MTDHQISRMPGFPHPGFPEGWFGVGWSSEFRPGDVVFRRYFGRDMILYRGETGRLVAMNAYCPHMGARLDVGGKVDGDCITCPFHRWKWDAEGNNVDIPYAQKTMKALLETYPVTEAGNIVWMWYSWRSPAPTWDAPDLSLIDDESYFWDDEASKRLWSHVRLTPQMVAENIVDGPHIKFVHEAADGGRIAEIEINGPVFRVEVDQTFRTGRGPQLGKTINDSIGVGTQISRMTFDSWRIVNVLTTTPIEEDRCDMRASIFIALPEGMAKPERATDLPDKLQRLIKSHLDSQEQDLPLWETMVYQAHPLLVAEEIQGHVKLRRWARQFYRPKAERPQPEVEQGW
jgi:phenylpropionate dioxygenase-like ring-hydroxylating dioxygenase large terminal subunit